MKLGYLIGYSQDALGQAKALGFDCLELNGWFSEDASSVKTLEDSKEQVRDELQKTGITCSALALYGNSLQAEDGIALSVFERIFRPLTGNRRAISAGRAAIPPAACTR